LNIQLLGEELHIHWVPGKTAVYLLKDLYRYFFPKNTPLLQYWDQKVITPLNYSWHYEAIIGDRLHLKDFLASVITYGFACLKGLPTEQERLLEVVQWFGYVRQTNYGKVFNVKSVPNPNNLAFTAMGLPPHTDNPYRDPVPTLQLLHCLKADAEGGESILIDGFKLASDLKRESPDYHKLLANEVVTYKFQDAHNCLEHKTTVIGVGPDDNYQYVRFNNRSIQPFTFDEVTMLNYYSAYQAFERKMQEHKYILEFKLSAGDLIVFDNERILHGRKAYTLTGERHLQRCYADRDGLYSRWRVL